MDTVSAFMMGLMNRDEEMMVFDWDKAARIIKERGATKAWAGLHDDYEWTGGIILEDGVIKRDNYTFLASTWATPTLYVGSEEIPGYISEEIPCYVMESQTEWHAYTKWPESAVKILMGDKYGEH